MKFLDQWLEYVDTDEVLPLFERLEMDYRIPQMDDVNWETYSHQVATVARDKNLPHLRLIDSTSDVIKVLKLVNEYGKKSYLREVYSYMLSLDANAGCCLDQMQIASALLNFLPEVVYAVPTFLRSQAWKTHKYTLEAQLVILAPSILQELVLATNELDGFIHIPFALLLSELKRLSLQMFAELVELIAFSVRSPEAALDLLLEVLEPETSRILVGRPTVMQQFWKCLFGIALDHIDEALNNRKPERETIRLTMRDNKDGYAIVNSALRIDSSIGGSLKVGDHVRLSVSNMPQNAPASKPFSMDAVVLTADKGSLTFRCLHKPPAYLNECAWTMIHCGSFTTSKTMFDAVAALYTRREACCRIYAQLVGLPDRDHITLPGIELPVTPYSTLNDSQNAALIAAMTHSLTFIWGPPGTGKTHTVVVILAQLLNTSPRARILVTAPTHNAVDNLLRRFVDDRQGNATGAVPLRVSTQVNCMLSSRSYWLLSSSEC
jgi:regulator of nonsense transcripts 1